MRKPNTTCSNCGGPMYCRPAQMEKQNTWFCSLGCLGKFRGNRSHRVCPFCNKAFSADHPRRKFCSVSCSNKARRGTTYSKISRGNKSQQRLAELYNRFNFSSCMVDGCTYNNTYDIHRLVPGRSGGGYEVGNMFAICPNHHAEDTRGIIKLIKVSDCLLKVKKIGRRKPTGDGTCFENKRT